MSHFVCLSVLATAALLLFVETARPRLSRHTIAAADDLAGYVFFAAIIGSVLYVLQGFYEALT